MWRIEVLIDTPTKFELGDTAADIQRRRDKREQRKKEEAKKQQLVEKRQRTERSESKMDTEGGAKNCTSQSHSRHKKGHMMSISLTDSEEEVIVRIMRSFTAKPTNTLRTIPGRITCGSGLQAAAT